MIQPIKPSDIFTEDKPDHTNLIIDIVNKTLKHYVKGMANREDINSILINKAFLCRTINIMSENNIPEKDVINTILMFFANDWLIEIHSDAIAFYKR